ncbi:MAG: hypothetical protein PVH19_15040 [Planctomycetia bacterium]|jgi:hypothetical protein
MAEARGRDAWQHTTSLLALHINMNRKSKNDPICKPDEINPYIKQPKVILRGKDLRILKDVFVK